MPTPYWKLHPNAGIAYRLRDAARDGRLLAVHCNGCGRTTYYLASDLAALLRPDLPAWVPQFDCSRCHTSDMMTVKPRSPEMGDYGHLKIRRPGPVRKIQTWRTVKLGDE